MSLKLIKLIATGSISFFDLSKQEMHEVILSSVVNGNFSALDKVTNIYTGLYDYDIHQPYWLKCNFYDELWVIELEARNGYITRKLIDWSTIILDDGIKLTSKSHTSLLNAFKYWITATDNPLENGGGQLKPRPLYEVILTVIQWINALLLYGKAINISVTHLDALDNDFLISILSRIGEGFVENGIYDYHGKLKILLLEEIKTISSDEADTFLFKYPYIIRDLLPEECVLGLSISQRVKACCWLEKQGFYRCGKSIVFQGNNTVLCNIIYKDLIIGADTLTFSSPAELKIGDKTSKTEYPAIPNQNTSNVVGDNVIIMSLKALKLLSVVNERNNSSHFPYEALQQLNLARIKSHVETKAVGRTKTLPIKLIFELIEDSYTFISNYQKSIFESTLKVLEKYTFIINEEESIRYKRIWKKKDALTLVDKSLIELGVTQLSISNMDDDVFNARRSNQGLIDLYNTLIGSIQLLVGVFLARRQDELLQLKPANNLFPNNIDPQSDRGKKQDYELVFMLKKTGSGGKYAANETVRRPIPRSIALIIWQLEQFNKKISHRKVRKGELGLFNKVNGRSLIIGKVNASTHNYLFNIICDYFETPLIQNKDGKFFRYYIRQHQLRRFFAMVFFWAKGFDGFDTLRWMLGHTDIEHLYNYISEAELGGVLNGIKASYLVDSISNNLKLENMDAMRLAIANRYDITSSDIEITSLSKAISDYDDNDFETIPTIDELRKREVLETQVLTLLNDHTISLEPEFFSVEVGNKKIQDYNLVLKVREFEQGR